MQDLGYILFGIVDGLVVACVFAGLTWAALRDGRDEREVRAGWTAPAAVPAAA